MVGEGTSLKMNRALLKKRSLNELRESYIDTSGKKTRIQFKEVTPIELAIIREKIKKDARKQVRKKIAIYSISAIITALIIYIIYWLNTEFIKAWFGF